MATVVFTVVGGALLAPYGLAPVGAALGAAAGGYLDAQYVYPTIFPPKPIQVGRIKELDLQHNDEGGPVNTCYGGECRVSGTIIWVSPATKVEASSGGKGTLPSGKITKFKYYVNIAIAVCEGQVSNFKKIWADGKLIYAKEPDFTVTSNQISLDYETIDPQYPKTKLIKLTAPAGAGLGFDQVRNRYPIIVSGFSHSANDGTFTVHSFISNLDGTVSLVLEEQHKGHPKEIAGNSITITQLNPTFDPKNLSSFNLFDGSDTQEPSATIESYEGVGNVSAYRGTAYVVIQNLELGRFLNRIPQFSFLVDMNLTVPSPAPLSTAVASILEKSKLQSTDYDVSGIEDVTIRGYMRQGIQPGRSALEPLLTAYNVIAQESAGKLYFKIRGEQDTIEIREEDLAAHTEDAGVPRPVAVDEIEESSIPDMVVINYRDPALTWQRGSQSERRIDAVTRSTSVFDLDLVLTSGEARSVAGRILWNAWRNQQSVTLTLPPHYLYIEEGDLLTFPAFDQVFTIMAQEVTFGADCTIEVTGVVEDVADFSGTDMDPSSEPPRIGLPATIRLEILDIAPLRDLEVSTPGYYFLGANADTTEEWQGAAVYSGPSDDQVEFKDEIITAGVIGKVIPTEEEIDYILDDAEIGTAASSGVWQVSLTGDDPYEGSSHIIARGLSGRFTWNLSPPESGDYKVYVRFTAASGRSEKALYQIHHTGGTADFRANQADEYLWDRWVLAGEYNIAMSGSYITLDAQDDGSVCADAVRLYKVRTTNLLGTGPTGYWDRAASVQVQLFTDATLESRTELEVLKGANLCKIGDEIIGFRTATLTDPNTYLLSNLLRGLRDTEGAVSHHIVSETFVLLDPQALNFRALDVGDMGTKKVIKAVAPGEIVDNVMSREYLLRGNSIRPFAPGHLTAEYSQGMAGIVIAYFYRTRATVRALAVTTWTGPGVEFEGFKIEIRDSTGLLRRSIETLQTSYHYDGTLQNLDGVPSGDVLTINVFQKSSAFGFGTPATITKQASI